MPKVRRSRSSQPGRAAAPAAPAPKRRRERKAPSTFAMAQTVPWGLVSRVAWAALTVGMLWYTGKFVVSKITWYLAVDQFGYLTFAHDLLKGHIFHDWPVATVIAKHLPPQTDMLAQTYVWDHGRLWCRYAIGFPLVLAGWIGIFGDDGAVYLNTTAYLALIVVMILFQWRITGSPWRGTAGAALLVLYPTLMHLWSLTLTRDMVNELVAFIGLLLLLPPLGRRLGPRRTLAAGVVLGFAGSIRPDGVLYGIPAALTALVRWRHEHRSVRSVLRPAAAGILGALLGLSPSFAYNYVTQGNPLMPTQGMEATKFFERTSALESPPPGPLAASERVSYPPPGWHGGTISQVQGGGLRLEHFNSTFPGNFALLVNGYATVGLIAAGVGALVAAFLHPLLFASAVPYVVIAMLFYSCWARPDNRYLLGVFTFLPMLIVEGTVGVLDAVRVVARMGRVNAARVLALLAATALTFAAFAPISTPNPVLPTMTSWLMGLTALGALAAALWPTRRIAGLAAPAVAIALVVLLVNRVGPQAEKRATFQHPEVQTARFVFGKAVEPGSVIITTEDIGRPAENIEYYSGVSHALYLTDVTRWRTRLPDLALTMIFADMRPYLLVNTSLPGLGALLESLKGFTVEKVLDIPPERAIEYFVAAPFHRGVRLELLRISAPEWERIWNQARPKTSNGS